MPLNVQTPNPRRLVTKSVLASIMVCGLALGSACGTTKTTNTSGTTQATQATTSAQETSAPETTEATPTTEATETSQEPTESAH